MIKHYKSTEFITSLRGLAAFLVFVIHSGGGGLRDMSPESNLFVDWGKYGVVIFFVISGYTIFYQFFERNYTLRYFLLQRILRISAPYWPLLVLVFIMGWNGTPLGTNYWGKGASGLDISGLNWFLHFTYLNFWSAEYSNTIIGVEWTLAIEVFYYVVLGVILKSYFFRHKHLFPTIILFMILFSVAIIGILIMKYGGIDNRLDIKLSPMLYGYMFALGGLAFFVRNKIEELFTHEILNILSNSVALLMFVFFIANLYFFYFSYIPIMFAAMTFLVIIFLRDESFIGKLVTMKFLLLFGSVSYSFYLWHFLILNTKFIDISYFYELPLIYDFVYKLIISFIIASIWYVIFEQKIYLYLKTKIHKYA